MLVLTKEFSFLLSKRVFPCKKAVHHFFTTDTIQWFQERGVELKTESDGRMFPVTDTSQSVIDVLLKEASRYQVEFKLHTAVENVNKENNYFLLQLSKGKVFRRITVVWPLGEC